MSHDRAIMSGSGLQGDPASSFIASCGALVSRAIRSIAD